MSRNLFYVLPLPLSAPSIKARLAGLSILRIPDGVSLEYATVKKLLLSKIPLHSIVSPVYLFKQHIDPFNLKHGMSSLEFVSECSNQLTRTSDQDILISFAFRHMSVLNAMAIQNFYYDDFFERFNYVIDLKVALNTCAYFGNTRLKQITNLNQVAKDLGFKGDLSNQLNRTEALHFIYQHLLAQDPKIMAFLTKPRDKRLGLVVNNCYVYLDDKGLYVVKVIDVSADGRIVKVIKANSSEMVLDTINLDFAPLVAPLTILTKERQVEHKFDLNEVLKRLNEAKLNELSNKADDWVIGERDLPFYKSFFKHLNAQEQQVFERLSRHDLRTETNISSIANNSTKFSAFVMCYINENFPGACFDAERKNYLDYCNEQLKRRSSSVVQECQMLFDNINDKDTQSLALLKRISSYF
ncbi:hypothetical protein MXE38_09680 [Anaerobiospirillum sp. NML120448]|uniref:hypothetical protein n=1 Tax=Anaerobiospirillum sp. NML120448 TaxID=2932816 RepID=UPI001FF6C6E2|nr:hypothetical protein [Anaerobiospirillum sp. NML120448]